MANEERKLPGIGVFGTGFRARAMVHLLNIHGFHITQVWDTNKIEAEKMAGKLNGASTSDKIDDVLLNSKVEMAVVCCKPHLQAQIAMKTLRLGKKVVCDPPAGTDASETRKVLDAATYYPSLMSSANYYLRFLPTFQCMKRFIEEGVVGKVRVVEVRVHGNVQVQHSNYEWYHDGRMGGGFLTNFGVHFIDIVAFVTGKRASKVHSSFVETLRRNTDKICGFREITSDDFCSFQMKTEEEVFYDVTFNNNFPSKFSYEVLVSGDKGYLRAKNNQLFGKDFSKDEDEEAELLEEDSNEMPKEMKEAFPGLQVEKMLPTPFCVGMVKFFALLKESLSTEKSGNPTWKDEHLKFSADFEDAIYVQHVLNCVRKSCRTSIWEQVSIISFNITTCL